MLDVFSIENLSINQKILIGLQYQFDLKFCQFLMKIRPGLRRKYF